MKLISLFVFLSVGVAITSTLPSPPECGRNSTKPDHFPWIVYLEHYFVGHSRQSFPSYITKGFLIDKDVVLTSATNIEISQGYRLEKIFFGEYAHMTENQTEEQYANRSYVLDVEIHPEADLAVITFGPAIEISDYIRPICLPESIDDTIRYKFYNYMCTKYTYANDNHDTHPSGHATRTRNLVRRWKKQHCDEYYYSLGTHLYPWQDCYSETRGNTCSGDYGSPLMYNDAGYHFAAGVASQAEVMYNTQNNSPTIYVNLMETVGKLLDWVKNTTSTRKAL